MTANHFKPATVGSAIAIFCAIASIAEVTPAEARAIAKDCTTILRLYSPLEQI